MNCQLIKDILRYRKIDCYAIHTPKREKQVFEKNILKCVTRPDLSGVPLKFNKHYGKLPAVLSVYVIEVDVLACCSCRTAGPWMDGVSPSCTLTHTPIYMRHNMVTFRL